MLTLVFTFMLYTCHYVDVVSQHIVLILVELLITELIFIWFQKEMQNVDKPFLYLANAFHKLYQDKLEVMKSLG